MLYSVPSVTSDRTTQHLALLFQLVMNSFCGSLAVLVMYLVGQFDILIRSWGRQPEINGSPWSVYLLLCSIFTVKEFCNLQIYMLPSPPLPSPPLPSPPHPPLPSPPLPSPPLPSPPQALKVCPTDKPKERAVFHQNIAAAYERFAQGEKDKEKHAEYLQYVVDNTCEGKLMQLLLLFHNCPTPFTTAPPPSLLPHPLHCCPSLSSPVPGPPICQALCPTSPSIHHAGEGLGCPLWWVCHGHMTVT